jgi:hypothetical protein
MLFIIVVASGCLDRPTPAGRGNRIVFGANRAGDRCAVHRVDGVSHLGRSLNKSTEIIHRVVQLFELTTYSRHRTLIGHTAYEQLFAYDYLHRPQN